MRAGMAGWVLALLATSLGAKAEIGEQVARLQREPMSLFDWGLHQLEEELQGVKRHPRDFLSVQYDPTLARIMVDASFFVETAEIKALGTRDACYVRLHAIKLMFGIIDTNKINVAPAADFRLGAKFSHRDSDAFPEQPDAARVGAELLDNVYIKVGIGSSAEDYPFLQDMRCEGELMTQDVHYGAEGGQAYLPETPVRAAPGEAGH